MKRDTKPNPEAQPLPGCSMLPPMEPAAPPKTDNRVEVTLSLSKKTKEQLDALQQTLDADSLSEVVRRAVQDFSDNPRPGRASRYPFDAMPFGLRTPWGW